MLKTLTFKGWQTHKKLEIKLDPHVTTIVGPSDVGKSAIIRGLEWVAKNQTPKGRYIHHDLDTASLILSVDDHEVRRVRGKTKNTYALDDQEFKAFGTDVPTDITQLLNLSEINFQGQHDSPFWFSSSAGEVSRQLNRIVNLEIIDQTLANLDKAGRDFKSRAMVLEGQLEEARAVRSDLKWAKKAEKSLGMVEEAEKKADTAHEVAASLLQTVQAVSLHQTSLERLGGAVKAAEVADNIGDKWLTAQTRLQGLRGKVEIIRELQPVVNQDIPDVEPLITLRLEMEEAEDHKHDLKNLMEMVQQTRQKVRNAEKEYKDARKKFEEEMGEICPLCERPL